MQNPPVSQAVSEETADRLVRGGLLRRAAGRSAPRHGGRLVRQEINLCCAPSVGRLVSLTDGRLLLSGTAGGRTAAAPTRWPRLCWTRITRSCRSSNLTRWPSTRTVTTAHGSRYAVHVPVVHVPYNDTQKHFPICPLNVNTCCSLSLSAGNSGQPYIYRVRPRDAIHRLRTRRTRHQVLGRLVWCPGNWELCYCGGVNERGGGGSGRVRVRQVEEEGRGRRAIGGLECRFWGFERTSFALCT